MQHLIIVSDQSKKVGSKVEPNAIRRFRLGAGNNAREKLREFSEDKMLIVGMCFRQRNRQLPTRTYTRWLIQQSNIQFGAEDGKVLFFLLKQGQELFAVETMNC